MQTNCTAFYKIVVNKKLQTYRVLFTFDAHNKLTVRNCVLATGDICDVANENASVHITKVLENAMQTLRCTSVAQY
jgi:hypothetical protein